MNYKHGYSNHPLYNVWRDMKRRCYDPDNKCYKDWGERGITVCDEWKNNPVKFIKWALPLWGKGLEIDRRNNDGNYTPENCRFVTRIENLHNQRLLRSDNTSGYRGVSYSKRDKKWQASIYYDNKRKHFGYFDTPELAATAYDNGVPDNRPKNFS